MRRSSRSPSLLRPACHTSLFDERDLLLVRHAVDVPETRAPLGGFQRLRPMRGFCRRRGGRSCHDGTPSVPHDYTLIWLSAQSASRPAGRVAFSWKRMPGRCRLRATLGHVRRRPRKDGLSRVDRNGKPFDGPETRPLPPANEVRKLVAEAEADSGAERQVPIRPPRAPADGAAPQIGPRRVSIPPCIGESVYGHTNAGAGSDS